MDKILLSIILSLGCFGISAQETWTDYYQDGKIKIQCQYSDCHNPQQGTHKQYVLIRLENLTAEKLSVNFTKELWYDGKCAGCDVANPENDYGISLAAWQAAEGSCDDKDKTLKIFSKMLDMQKSKLTKFELKNIRIN